MLCLCGFALYSRWVPLTFRILLVYHLLAQLPLSTTNFSTRFTKEAAQNSVLDMLSLV